MLTVKQLMESSAQQSLDGIHWEPCIFESHSSIRQRVRDTIAVLTGKAAAIRNTQASDLETDNGEV